MRNKKIIFHVHLCLIFNFQQYTVTISYKTTGNLETQQKNINIGYSYEEYTLSMMTPSPINFRFMFYS